MRVRVRTPTALPAGRLIMAPLAGTLAVVCFLLVLLLARFSLRPYFSEFISGEPWSQGGE